MRYMNKKPIWYLQTDPRWKSVRLPCNGGTMSIGGGGCGPTSAAMLVETLTGKPFSPVEAMKWACQSGFVTANQGTDYAYFKPQLSEHGINCDMLTWTPCLSVNCAVRSRVEDMLRGGYYFIALMKKGLWTNGGHYIVVWWADDKIYINDPASTRPERLLGDPAAFWSTAKYFWWVDARQYNKESEDEEVERYNSIQEIDNACPWAVKTIEMLINKGLLKGSGELCDEQGRPSDLDLSRDMLRILVMNDRAGCYDK